MNDELEFPEDLDPALLLPFEREIEPHDEIVEKLPFKFQGSGDDSYTGAAAF